MIRPAGLDVSHRGGRQRVVMFFDLTDENGEQPGVGLVHEDDAVALVLIEDFKQRQNVGRISPARVVRNRSLDLARPEKIFRVVREDDQILRPRLQAGNILSRSLGVGRKALQLPFVQSRFDGPQHAFERRLKPAVQIAGFALIDIEIDAQNRTVRHRLASNNRLDIGLGYHLILLHCPSAAL